MNASTRLLILPLPKFDLNVISAISTYSMNKSQCMPVQVVVCRSCVNIQYSDDSDRRDKPVAYDDEEDSYGAWN
jgi:hypothetical protein